MCHKMPGTYRRKRILKLFVKNKRFQKKPGYEIRIRMQEDIFFG